MTGRCPARNSARVGQVRSAWVKRGYPVLTRLNFPMAEIIQRDGTWAFDGSTVQDHAGLQRFVPLLRQTYGEIAVPLEAVAGRRLRPERKRGELRLRLREGADPLLQATGGRLPETRRTRTG